MTTAIDLLPRRAILAGLAGFATAPARAQADYPARPITVVIGWAAGTSNDTIGRFVADAMSRELRVPMTIDNRPGAASSLATGQVLRAPPDGHTILFGAAAMLINHILKPDQPPTRPQLDLVPVGRMVDLPLLIHINNELPARSLQELIAYARANPGRLACGTSPNGSIGHLALELIKQEADVDIVHVPYNVAPAMLPDLFSGRIQMAITAPLRQTQSRMLAVTSAERFPGLPDVPTVREALGLEDYDVASWQAVFVRAGTPVEIVQRLEAALAIATADPTVVARSIPAGGMITPGGADSLARLVHRDLGRWRRLIERRSIRAD